MRVSFDQQSLTASVYDHQFYTAGVPVFRVTASLSNLPSGTLYGYIAQDADVF